MPNYNLRGDSFLAQLSRLSYFYYRNQLHNPI